MWMKTTRYLLSVGPLFTLWLFAFSGIGQAQAPMHLTLPDAIDLALKQNRSLGLARLAVVDSEHKREVARSAYFPHIKNESSILHITELAGVAIPAGAFGVTSVTGPIPGNNLLIDQGALTGYTSGTGLAQPFTQMFKIHESNRAAAADINTAKIQVRSEERRVGKECRSRWSP